MYKKYLLWFIGIASLLHLLALLYVLTCGQILLSCFGLCILKVSSIYPLWHRFVLSFYVFLFLFYCQSKNNKVIIFGYCFLLIEFITSFIASLGVGLSKETIAFLQLDYQVHLSKIWLNFLIHYCLFFILWICVRIKSANTQSLSFFFALLFVFLPLFSVYMSNGYISFGGDNFHNSVLPQHILHGGSFPFGDSFIKEYGRAALVKTDKGYIPPWPIGTSLFVFPGATIQYLGNLKPDAMAAAWNQKTTSSLLAALSAALLFYILQILNFSLCCSLLCTYSFALGTSQLNISALTLWQHGPCVFLILLGMTLLLLAERSKNDSYYGLCGFTLSLLPFVRQPSGVFYLSGLAYILLTKPRAVFRFFALSIIPLFFTLWFNLNFYGHIAGSYVRLSSSSSFSSSFFEGLAGLLFSPNRGLFALSPFLIFSLFSLPKVIKQRLYLPLTFFAASLAYLLIHAKFSEWWAGWTLGARYTTEIVPVLVLLFAYYINQQKSVYLQRVIYVFIALSLFINIPSFFFAEQTAQWNICPDINKGKARVWDLRDWMPIHYRYFLNYANSIPTSVFAFTADEKASCIEDSRYTYRVRSKQSKQLFHLPTITLNQGNWTLRVKGRSLNTHHSQLIFNAEFVYQRFDKFIFSIPPNEEFSADYSFLLDRPSDFRTTIELKGKGLVEFDSVEIIENEKLN